VERVSCYSRKEQLDVGWLAINGGRMRRNLVVGVLISVTAGMLILSLMRFGTSRASASTTSGSEVIHKANGLPPYQVSQALMAVAQAHSECQAAQGSVTQTGLGDNLHLVTMLPANYQGAGVAVADDTFYYTLDVGALSGAVPAATSDSTPPTSEAVQGTPASTDISAAPIKIATPRPDGAVVHVVGHGQVLWNIAAAYKVSVAELMALNSLTERSVIYPGEKLLIKPAESTQAITATQTISATATRLQPSNTPRPTRTQLSSTLTPIVAALPGEGNDTSNQQSQPTARQILAGFKADPLLILIAVLVVIGTGLVLAGNVMKRRSRQANQPPEL
jgi:LysM repeat protein